MLASSGLHPERLLCLARDGQVNALGQLLEVYRSYLWLCSQLQIRRRLQGKVDASDLVQETFLQAERAFGQFRGKTEAELLQWLKQILASRVAKAVRRFYGTQARDVRLERQLNEELDRSSQLAQALVVAQSSPSHHAVRREQAVLLSEALGELPDDYREVIVLRHLEALSFPEVARLMGRSEEATKKLWIRALNTLRRALGGEDHEFS